MALETRAKETFRCRKCRFVLFTEEDLSQNHIQKTECLSWYLNDDEDMLEWVQANIDQVRNDTLCRAWRKDFFL